MQWAAAPQVRQQLVLFERRLDDALAPAHPVRLLDEILAGLDWSAWEGRYHGRLGQPPIHPRVLAGVLLYGLLRRIRSSRALEEALQVRLDFIWLVEGRSIDHTTLSEFRRTRSAELQQLFVQVCLVAQQLGWLPLQELGFDGTRLRANNRRRGTRTPHELRAMQQELAAKFTELETQVAAEDQRHDETFGSGSPHELAAEWARVEYRQTAVEAALAELAQLEAAGETLPQRVPLTDPQSRLMPNKEGGFAPNYTPLATVDMAHGLIVATDVIAQTNEDQHLGAALDQVQAQFGLESPPPALLADGLMATGTNLAALDERGVTLYSPASEPAAADNPAVRADPTQPVPSAEWEQLPLKKVGGRGKPKPPQFDSSAFVYDAAHDVYYCPQGVPLKYRNTTPESRVNGPPALRLRYLSDAHVCAMCPLRERCLTPGRKQREVSHDQYRELRARHVERMATPAAQAKYARRCFRVERPFAVIKQQFGARRFLLRGLERVRTEWRWLATAFNLERLMSLLLQSRAGPAPA